MRLVALLLATWSVLLSGCDGAMAPRDGGRTDVDEAVDSPSGMGTFVVQVLSPGEVPVPGATVAMDGPTRVEMLSGPDGRATFAVDWSAGTVDVIAWANGYGVRAWVGLTRADYEGLVVDGALPLRVRGEFSPPSIELTGGFLNSVSPDSYVFVFTDLAVDSSVQQTMYQLGVPRGRPFQLTAIEAGYTGDDVSYDQPVLAFVRPPPSPASDTNLTIDIDLAANRVTPTEISGSFPLPPDPWFDTAYPYIVVTDTEEIASFGVSTAAHPRPDGTALDYSSAYVLPTPTTPSVTNFSMNTADGRTTFATVRGPPASGPQTFTFLTPPVLDPPPGGGFRRVFDEASVALTPGAIFTWVVVGGGRMRAEVSGPPGAGRVRLPDLPAGAGAAGLFTGSLVGYARLCVLEPTDATHRRCALLANGATEAVDP